MKKLLVFFLSITITSCGVHQYIENENFEKCSTTTIPKSMYSFNIEWYKKHTQAINYHQIEVQNDSSKIVYRDKENYKYNYKYSVTSTSKKNNSDIFYRYDSIGRLVIKYDRHTGTNIGEEIKFKYSDAKSTTPIETYRVNYDTIYPICWKEALQIATKKGIKPQDVHLDIQYPLNYWDEKKPMEWIIYDDEHIMYVDAFTGKATNLRKKGSGLPTN